MARTVRMSRGQLRQIIMSEASKLASSPTKKTVDDLSELECREMLQTILTAVQDGNVGGSSSDVVQTVEGLFLSKGIETEPSDEDEDYEDDEDEISDDY